MDGIELKGKYGTATIYAKTIEDKLFSQCINMLNSDLVEDVNIAIMPDTHVGKGCMIGTTMEIKDKVCPNLVGVDIGCGMLTVKLGQINIDFEKLDDIITEYVPLGFNCHDNYTKKAEEFFDKYKDSIKAKGISYDLPMRSIGTLGGGNHFLEVDKDRENNLYLIIHTGSRNFGKQIAEYWQNVAIEELCKKQFIDPKPVIAKLKEEGREREIQKALEDIKIKNQQIKSTIGNKDLAYLTGDNLKDYLNDLHIAQLYASLNRETIANVILKNYFGMPLSDFTHFETIHNYINVDEMILRKGAISAKEGEIVLIPLNMRDGALIAVGKGNEKWNNSAPHGAGRLMSRGQAKELVNLEDFKESMKGIYSSSVVESTIDESPFAYKDAEEIIECVQDTVKIIEHIKPIYNRKAS